MKLVKGESVGKCDVSTAKDHTELGPHHVHIKVPPVS